jgi:hypothetical protein
VVYTGTEAHFGHMLLSLYSLRLHLDSELPVEVWVPPTDKEACQTKVASEVSDVTCRLLPDHSKGWMSKIVSPHHEFLGPLTLKL